MRVVMVTGGAGFIGANLTHQLLDEDHDTRVVVYDALTYAGNLDNIEGRIGPRCVFERGDICDGARVADVLRRHRPHHIFHLAAESHVDRSIDGPGAFVRTNVQGTFEMLEAARGHYYAELSPAERASFRFIHVSTDEVYGSLGAEGAFRETTPYAPNSPYAASKAAADHLARAYHVTYRLPVITTNCSNNYGPHQFPEKLIPLVILNAIEGRPLPVYGDGANTRDWLFVGDHARALRRVAAEGRVGETYNVGGRAERTTLEVVRAVCAALETERPRRTGRYEDLITFVEDRPGHDFRYAIDPTKLETELGWTATMAFAPGISTTVRWYLEHEAWCERIHTGTYRRERLGLDGGDG
ncbi:MAG: dTDP-glucose 4,6-dehydratase [Myxococcota bacterium]